MRHEEHCPWILRLPRAPPRAPFPSATPTWKAGSADTSLCLDLLVLSLWEPVIMSYALYVIAEGPRLREVNHLPEATQLEKDRAGKGTQAF